MFAVKLNKKIQLIFLKKEGYQQAYTGYQYLCILFAKNTNQNPSNKKYKELVTLPLFSDIKISDVNYIIKN